MLTKKSVWNLTNLKDQDPLLLGETHKLFTHWKQHATGQLNRYTKKCAFNNKMKINKNKTQVRIFNKSWKLDFPPELKFTYGTFLEVFSQMKLVGLIISDNFSWHENTIYICRKARTKILIIRIMKSLSLCNEELFEIYCKEIRS